MKNVFVTFINMLFLFSEEHYLDDHLMNFNIVTEVWVVGIYVK